MTTRNMLKRVGWTPAVALEHPILPLKRSLLVADRRSGMTSGNGQAWSLPNSRGQRRTEKTGGKLVMKSSVVPQRPPWLRDR